MNQIQIQDRIQIQHVKMIEGNKTHKLAKWFRLITYGIGKVSKFQARSHVHTKISPFYSGKKLSFY